MWAAFFSFIYIYSFYRVFRKTYWWGKGSWSQIKSGTAIVTKQAAPQKKRFSSEKLVVTQFAKNFAYSMQRDGTYLLYTVTRL
jgi:hypothetical protein